MLIKCAIILQSVLEMAAANAGGLQEVRAEDEEEQDDVTEEGEQMDPPLTEDAAYPIQQQVHRCLSCLSSEHSAPGS